MKTMILENPIVWYVDFGASNHMAYCVEWFKDMHNLKILGLVQIGNDTIHPIAHVGDVPLHTYDVNGNQFWNPLSLCVYAT